MCNVTLSFDCFIQSCFLTCALSLTHTHSISFSLTQVFLKEHSRGLYSAFLRWVVEDKPLLLLRFFQGLMYAVIVHEWIGYQGGGKEGTKEGRKDMWSASCVVFYAYGLVCSATSQFCCMRLSSA